MQTVNFFAGRFNPLTIKHHEIISNMLSFDGRHILFIIDGEKTSKDKNKNPLDSNIRYEVIKDCFPSLKVDVASNVYNCLDILDIMGFKNINWFCGEDRHQNYQKISKDFDANINIVSFSRNDDISATKVREGIITGKDVDYLLPDLSVGIKNKIKGIIKNVSSNNTSRSG